MLRNAARKTAYINEYKSATTYSKHYTCATLVELKNPTCKCITLE